MDQSGFLGTSATLGADITLVAYLLILIPLMVIGFIFARGKRFEPHHKLVMTTVTLANWALIFIVMLVTYTEAVAPGVPDNLGERDYWLPTLHLITGGTAQLLATYLLTRMWFENSLPAWYKIRNIKRPMRLTLGLWVFTAALGITMYAMWYTGDAVASGDVPPISTEEAPEEATPEATESVDAPLSTEEAPEATPESAEAPLSTEEAPTETATPDAPLSTEEPEPITTEEAE